jgi:hypothetical protein
VTGLKCGLETAVDGTEEWGDNNPGFEEVGLELGECIKAVRRDTGACP